MMSREQVKKARACADLLNPPAPDVVRELCDTALEAMEERDALVNRYAGQVDVAAILQRAHVAEAERDVLRADLARNRLALTLLHDTMQVENSAGRDLKHEELWPLMQAARAALGAPGVP